MADALPCLLIGSGKLELRLKVQPELRVGLEPMAKAQSCVARNRALTRNDLGYTVRRHIDLTGKFCGCNPDFGQLVFQDGAGVDWSHEHVQPPFIGDSPQFQRLLVLIGLLAIRNTRAIAG